MRLDDGIRFELYDQQECADGWEKLGLGHEIPEGYTVKEAWEIARKIWLAAIKDIVHGHPLIVSAAFTNAIYGPIEVSGKLLYFDDFKRAGLAGGVDYMIDAWLAGTPLEYILGEE